ncbi:MAG: GGDEF domain-containing protein [Alcanivoracaceae bacterium]|nr:GGDEF domain-containing protein [Alcanivoracaceae bacterium]
MQMKNRLMILINVIFVFISFLAQSNSMPESASRHFTEKAITEILQETDDIRISNVDLFAANLAQLEILSQKKVLSSYQDCYYQYLLAHDLGYKGKYDLAKQKINDIFKQCDDPNNKIRSKLLLSNLQVISHDYESAINNLDYTITNINSTNEPELKNSVYSRASLVYRLVDQNELSLKFAELLINNNPSESFYCNGLVAKYRILLKIGDYQNIENKIRQTIDVCENSGNYILSSFLKLEWLDIQLSKSTTIQEKTTILNALKLAEIEIIKARYQNLISIKDSMFAKVYWSLQNDEKAFEYAKLSLEESKGIGSTKQEIVSLQILVDYYRKIGEPEQAIKLLIRKNQSEKLHYDDQQAKTMAYLTIRHENLAKSHQINFLNQQNKVLSLENKLADKAALMQQLIILFLIVLVTFFVLWGVKHKKIQQIYKKLSERDHMTLIFNRKGLRDHMDVMLATSEQNDKEVGFAIFDLDLFKSINDRYGHMTGDWVIKNVIKTCQKINNGKVTLGRLGGEEFAIVLHNSSLDELKEYCECCRININNLCTIDSGHDFKISASFGITTTKTSGFVYTTMLTDADEALYIAKNSGRNQTVTYQAA